MKPRAIFVVVLLVLGLGDQLPQIVDRVDDIDRHGAPSITAAATIAR